ncbi:MAG: RNA polymerase sigma-70 factor [Chlorobi bacterium]|nr:RNA polymerase sigma-70 factor [Chlorobiota bacterium]
MTDNKKHLTSNLDEPQFEKIFKTHFQSLCYYANTFLKDLDNAKEIVHDVFINFWEKREKIDINKPIKAYLYTSVHNRCLNYIRDHKKFNYSIERIEDLNVNSAIEQSDTLIVEEIKQKINEILEMLPEKARKIFELSRFEGLKYQEIADELGISVKTVEANMSKALKLFRENLKDYIGLLVILIDLLLILKKLR